MVIVCWTAVEGSAARADLGVQILLADQHAAARIRQDLDQLPLAQHRIARHDHRAALPDGEHRDQHLRDVLQIHRHAIAGLHPVPLQRDRQGIRHHIALVDGDRLIEVVHQDGITAPQRRRAGTCPDPSGSPVRS